MKKETLRLWRLETSLPALIYGSGFPLRLPGFVMQFWAEGVAQSEELQFKPEARGGFDDGAQALHLRLQPLGLGALRHSVVPAFS